jgi:hypothetical protein
VAGKSTNAEMKLRVNEVYGLLTRGYSRAQIQRHAADLWGCSERSTDTYIQRAREILDKDCEMSRPAFLAEALARLRVVEQKAEERSQLANAIAAIRLQCELIGLTQK